MSLRTFTLTVHAYKWPFVSRLRLLLASVVLAACSNCAGAEQAAFAMRDSQNLRHFLSCLEGPAESCKRINAWHHLELSPCIGLCWWSVCLLKSSGLLQWGRKARRLLIHYFFQLLSWLKLTALILAVKDLRVPKPRWINEQNPMHVTMIHAMMHQCCLHCRLPLADAARTATWSV